MRPFLAILLVFLTLLPHPALLAVEFHATAECAAKKECRPICPCCQGGACACAEKSDSPPDAPLPAVPLRGAELHPVPTLPPQAAPLIHRFRLSAAGGIRADVPSHRVLRGKAVPLFVQHCAFLI